MEWFLDSQGILFKDFKPFVLQQAERIRIHGQAVAAKAGRPYVYLESSGGLRMDEKARAMAQKDGISRGLICVFSRIEPCRTYRLIYAKPKPRLVSAQRKCLYLYFYFLDREFGLMHVKIQTWFPFQIQVYLNGHDWLAHKMDRHHLGYQRIDNAFVWLESPSRAQRLADNMLRQNWLRVLDGLARRANPLLRDLFQGSGYYWVISQSEYSTDLVFKDSGSLKGLYQDLLQHATVCLSAEDVLTFLGKKLSPAFQGELLTDFKHRKLGARVKHQVKTNWIKMYDKFGRVLRIETVIQHPYDFKIRRRGTCNGKPVVGWFPMCKRVTTSAVIVRSRSSPTPATSRPWPSCLTSHKPARIWTRSPSPCAARVAPSAPSTLFRIRTSSCFERSCVANTPSWAFETTTSEADSSRRPTIPRHNAAAVRGCHDSSRSFMAIASSPRSLALAAGASHEKATPSCRPRSGSQFTNSPKLWPPRPSPELLRNTRGICR